MLYRLFCSLFFTFILFFPNLTWAQSFKKETLFSVSKCSYGGNCILGVSEDGKLVTFVSSKSNVESTNSPYNSAYSDIYLYDRDTSDISKITIGVDDKTANENSYNPIIIDDDRILFSSNASNLVSGTTTNVRRLYLYDIASKAISLVSTPANIVIDSFSASKDGQHVYLLSNSILYKGALASDSWETISFDGNYSLSLVGVGTNGNLLLKSSYSDCFVYIDSYESKQSIKNCGTNSGANISSDGTLVSFISSSRSAITQISVAENTLHTKHIPISNIQANITVNNRINFSDSGLYASAQFSSKSKFDSTKAGSDVYWMDLATGKLANISSEDIGTSRVYSYPIVLSDNIVTFSDSQNVYLAEFDDIFNVINSVNDVSIESKLPLQTHITIDGTSDLFFVKREQINSRYDTYFWADKNEFDDIEKGPNAGNAKYTVWPCNSRQVCDFSHGVQKNIDVKDYAERPNITIDNSNLSNRLRFNVTNKPAEATGLEYKHAGKQTISYTSSTDFGIDPRDRDNAIQARFCIQKTPGSTLNRCGHFSPLKVVKDEIGLPKINLRAQILPDFSGTRISWEGKENQHVTLYKTTGYNQETLIYEGADKSFVDNDFQGDSVTYQLSLCQQEYCNTHQVYVRTANRYAKLHELSISNSDKNGAAVLTYKFNYYFDHVELYRYSIGLQAAPVKIANLSPAGGVYRDSERKNNFSYIYRIVGCYKNDCSYEMDFGSSNSTSNAYPEVKAPTNVTVSTNHFLANTISWNAVDGVDGYIVRAYDHLGSLLNEWVVEDGESNQFVHHLNDRAGLRIQYSVQSGLAKSDSLYSSYSRILSLPVFTSYFDTINSAKNTTLAEVDLLETEQVSSQELELSANVQYEFDYLNIYIKTESEDEYRFYEQVSYLDSYGEILEIFAPEKEQYRFKVVGCSILLNKCTEGAETEAYTFYPPVNSALPAVTPVLSVVDREYIKIELDALKGQYVSYIEARVVSSNGYTNNYRLENEDGNYSIYRTDLKPGTSFSIETRYCTYNPNFYCSEFSEAVVLTIPADGQYPPQIPNFYVYDESTNQTAQTRISVSITREQFNEGVKFIKLYRSIDGSEPNLLATLDESGLGESGIGLEYIDRTAKAGASNSYYIRACSAALCSKLSNASVRILNVAPNDIPAVPTAVVLQSKRSKFDSLDLSGEYDIRTEKIKIEYGKNANNFNSSALLNASRLAFDVELTNLQQDTEYFARVQACNSLGCSEWSEPVSAKTFSKAQQTASISGETLFLVNSNSNARDSMWRVSGSTGSAYGRIDTLQGTLQLRSWFNISQGISVSSEQYWALSNNVNQCQVISRTALTLDSILSPDYWAVETYQSDLVRLVYTGAGCDDLSGVEPYHLYLLSDYFSQPVLLDGNESWLNKWQTIKVVIDEEQKFDVLLDGVKIASSDLAISLDGFKYSQFTWEVTSASTSRLSQVNVDANSNEFDSALFTRLDTQQLKYSAEHPRMVQVNQMGITSSEVWNREENQFSKIKQIDSPDHSQNTYGYVTNLNPSASNSLFVKYCLDEKCSPLFFNKVQTPGYGNLSYLRAPDRDYPKAAGLIEVSIALRPNGYADTYQLWSKSQNETAWVDLGTLSYLDIISTKLLNGFTNYLWAVDRYNQGDEVQFKVVYCNPVGCQSSPESEFFNVPKDSDQDGVIDELDAFPNDPNETYDTDHDGVGNNSDMDDDGDGMSDEFEIANGLDPLNSYDAKADSDEDGFINILEFEIGTDLFDPSSHPDKLGTFLSFEPGEPNPLTIKGRWYQSYPYPDNSIHGNWALAIDTRNSQPEATIEMTATFNKGVVSWVGQKIRGASSVDPLVKVNGVFVPGQNIEQTKITSSGWVLYSFAMSAGYKKLEFVVPKTGTSAYYPVYFDSIYLPVNKPAVNGDFDGDGKAELAARNPFNGDTYIKPVGEDSHQTISFGKSSDIPVLGDFDGDKIADIAIRRTTDFTFYSMQSAGGMVGFKRFGLQSGDIPVLADYDGDGITDYAIRRPSNSTWYILNSSTDKLVTYRFGLQKSDIPVPADYDGDGKADIAIRRPSNGTWYIRLSATGKVQVTRFGIQSSDIPVVADYDGDRKADIAVRRPSNGTWYILQSRPGYGMHVERFGLDSKDIPVVADYDGDGKADIAVRRPSIFKWYILQSTTSEVIAETFGTNALLTPLLARWKTVKDMTVNKHAKPESGNAQFQFDGGPIMQLTLPADDAEFGGTKIIEYIEGIN
ncbi:FG-GAP-like repeat-containing protein [Neptunicella marina]|uniref:VCBS repeat-containing protein n=1 Tax=Neptunicella marina TaxID=2125989 RepID=A0A8J6M0N4_9ALTE|nr:FG-GAP-like repeat-containing protein [Neptunicella marina]MBC3764947.1 VCBS repeat-containing protein [Neptunicella marina]